MRPTRHGLFGYFVRGTAFARTGWTRGVLFDEKLETLEYAATAFFFDRMPVTTTLQVSIGETLFELPVEFEQRRGEAVGSDGPTRS